MFKIIVFLGLVIKCKLWIKAKLTKEPFSFSERTVIRRYFDDDDWLMIEDWWLLSILNETENHYHTPRTPYYIDIL